MRVESHEVGSFVHVMKRGARGLPIARDDADRRRFVRLLYYMNDEGQFDYWDRATSRLGPFARPNSWPARRPLVKVLAWVLMPNHFHLFLKEIQDGGIAKFMQRLCGSMSAHFNAKYDERGSIFQGGYRGRTIDSDEYLRQVAPYIMVKNVFELYPGGYEQAIEEFDKAWRWGVEVYPFSSLPNYATEQVSPIIDKDLLGEIFDNPDTFYAHARDVIMSRSLEKDEI